MITEKEAEGIAFGQLLTSLQDEKSTREEVSLRFALLNLEKASGGHATLADTFSFLERMQDQIIQSRRDFIQLYGIARYPVGSSFRIQVLETIFKDGLGNIEEDLALVPGSYTVQVVVRGEVAWVVPEGMSRGISLETLLVRAGVTGSRTARVIIQLLED